LLSVPYALFSGSASTAGNGVPSGGTAGQVLTLCNGVATWTTGGQCPPIDGSITILDCASAINDGSLTSGIAASGVNSIVPYDGGNGGPYNGQTVVSTGVTGLTATLSAGTFVDGNGSLAFTITGTPNGSGNAIFELSVGGKMCSLTRMVNASSGIESNAGDGVTFNGYKYPSVRLGNGQEWMAENLRTSFYANGDIITNVTSVASWKGLNSGAWAHYENNSGYENPYGKLYNWYAVVDPRNICPTGWHVPSDAEWTALIAYLGSDVSAGGKMKTIGTQYWQIPNQDATNESGFSALPGGLRDESGSFGSVGEGAYWWGLTQFDDLYAYLRYLSNNDGSVYSFNFDKRFGLSVRCIKD
jgi:uncharacterized protein (TIGR02145 family)